MNLPTFTKTRVAVLAGALGAAGALSMVAASASPDDAPTTVEQARSTPSSDDNAPGDISGNCDEAEHANDAECRGAPAGTTPTTPTTAPAGITPTTVAPMPSGNGSTAGAKTLQTPGGAVTYRSSGGTVTVVAATPSAGWRVEVEQSSGREVELDFRAGSQRVQVNLEFEDGVVRERVRLRDDANDTDVRTENGVVTSDDNSGNSGSSGSGSSGSESSGSMDDNSGSGSGSSDDSGHGGNSGSGSGGHGSDDSGSDDHGGRSSDDG